VKVPEKVKVFAWKVANNGIPTQANKCYRHIASQATCEMCGHWTENCFHACIQCPHAVALRHAMRDHWVLPPEKDLMYTGPDWLLVLMSKFSAEVNANLLMLLWRIWSERNSVLRAGKKISVEGSVVFLTRYMDSLLQRRHITLQTDSKGKRCELVGSKRPAEVARQAQQKWVPPPPGMLKINVDGAFISSSGTAAVGVVIRDHNGQVKLASWRLLRYCRDAEEAEVVACCEGIALAARWPDVPMVLETDSAVVAAKLKSSVMDRSVGWSIVREVRMYMEELFSLDIVKISRSQNYVAHELAHLAIRSGRSEVFFAFFPEFVLSRVCNDIT
jgi:ribonuclease HI